ncbi:MAG: type II toxin-antitoxin system VapC family toxin [Terracidiphilus sp.]
MSEPRRVFLDTSVLIAACDSEQPGHGRSRQLLASATQETSACGAHTLAEVYTVLSRLPGGGRQRPKLAGQLIAQIADRVTVVPLTAEEYQDTIRSAARFGVAGGSIYDALLVACARKVNADRIYTWNVRHLQMVAPGLAERIVEP